MQITFSERELEDFLCTGKNLEKYLGLKFVARQVNIAPAGIIDILAYHKQSKTWVIIELKKDIIGDGALLQILSYLNYYKATNPEFEYKDFLRKRKFSGLLVGSSLDHNSNFIRKILCSKHSLSHREGAICYTLFRINLETGISFDYMSPFIDSYTRELDDIRWEGLQGRYLKIDKNLKHFEF